jgi:pyruvate dehydrogenase E2 component (dihydrolipoamide acetyltransferase)
VAEPEAPATGQRGDSETVELSATESAHARRVAEVMATVPHVYLDAHLEGESPTAQIVRACALALREHPRVNGAYRDGQVRLHSRVNIGVGMVGDGALVYPVVADADAKETGEIAAELEALAAKAAAGGLARPDLSGATFSLADLTGMGADRVTAAVNRGQAAMLTVAGVAGRGRTLSLACDNRVVHAPEGAAFLGRVRELVAMAG